MGLKTAQLVNEKQKPGQYKYSFIPDQQFNSSGVYYLRFTSGNKRIIKKITEL